LEAVEHDAGSWRRRRDPRDVDCLADAIALRDMDLRSIGSKPKPKIR
jgi:hypothetical protein